MKYAARLGSNLASVLEGLFLAVEILIFGVLVGMAWAAIEIRQSWGK